MYHGHLIANITAHSGLALVSLETLTTTFKVFVFNSLCAIAQLDGHTLALVALAAVFVLPTAYVLYEGRQLEGIARQAEPMDYYSRKRNALLNPTIETLLWLWLVSFGLFFGSVAAAARFTPEGYAPRASDVISYVMPLVFACGLLALASTFCATAALWDVYPSGYVLDTERWDMCREPKPHILETMYIHSRVSFVGVLSLRAQGFEPEQWIHENAPESGLSMARRIDALEHAERLRLRQKASDEWDAAFFAKWEKEAAEREAREEEEKKIRDAREAAERKEREEQRLKEVGWAVAMEIEAMREADMARWREREARREARQAKLAEERRRAAERQRAAQVAKERARLPRRGAFTYYGAPRYEGQDEDDLDGYWSACGFESEITKYVL